MVIICLGITPLYDAASNGHLEVVQLLIDKGAIPSLKTDFGETPLDVLQKWRTQTILNKDEETLYNNICNKIHSYIDKSNTVDVFNRSKSKTPIKPKKDVTPPSTSKLSNKIKELTSPAKRRNIIDDSDDDLDLSQNVRNLPVFPSDDSNSSEGSLLSRNTLGVKAYKEAISALRNRNMDDLPEVEIRKKPKPALLAPDEVDDDWLDDDLGINKQTKKRKLSDPLTIVAKKPTMETIKDSIDIINKITPLVENNKTNERKKSRISDIVDLSDNSSDSDMFQRNENVCPKVTASESMRNIAKDLNESKLKDTRINMRRRWKQQSTLLKAGFQRKRDEVDQSSNSGSDNEFTTRKDKRWTNTGSLSRKNSGDNLMNPVSFTRKKSNENFFNTNDGFNVVQSLNPNIMQPVNVIQPINIVQSKNGRPVQTQILPPAAVKVQVEDKVLLISLKLDAINKLTISWLVEEVKSRYYKYVDIVFFFSFFSVDCNRNVLCIFRS